MSRPALNRLSWTHGPAVVTLAAPLALACPADGRPATGDVAVTYEPGAWAAEAGSFRAAVVALTAHPLYAEAAAAQFLRAFADRVRPRWAECRVTVTTATGTTVTATVRHGPDPPAPAGGLPTGANTPAGRAFLGLPPHPPAGSRRP